MAEKKIGARIVLEGEAEYRQALKEINAEQRELRSELKLCATEFDGQNNSLEALTKQNEILTKQYEVQSRKVEEYNKMLEQSQKAQDGQAVVVDDLRKKLEEAQKTYDDMSKSGNATTEDLEKQKKVIDELQDSYDKEQKILDNVSISTQNWKTNVNEGNAELNKLGKELDNNNKYLEEAKASTDGCAKSIDEFGKEIKEADEDSKNFGKDVKSSIDALSTALVTAGVVKSVEEISEALLDCVNSADRFDTAIAKVTTVANMGATSYGQLSQEIMAISNEVGIMSTNIAEATYQAISAGVETGNAVKFAGEASKLAVAGFTDSATAVDIMTTALNAYGMSAEESMQVSNQLLITQNLGKTTVEELATSLGKVIPTASAANVDFANLATSMAIMTQNGIKTRFAITDMNAMLNELSDEGSTVSAVLKEQTGKSFVELMESGKSLGDVLQILGNSVNGNKVAFKNLWSQSTSGIAGLSLMQSGAEKFNAVLNEMNTNTNATAKAFETMSGTSEYATQRMEVAVDNLKIAIGSELSPVLTDATEGVTDIVEVMTKWLQENEWLVDTVSALVAGVGTMAMGLAGAVAAIKAVELAQSALNVVMAANPYILAATAISGLVVGLGTLIAMTSDANSEIETFNSEVKAIKDNINNSSESFKSQRTSIESNEIVARGLMATIKQLNSVEKLNTDQKMQLKNAVDQLNAIYPELAIQIDETTGKISENTSELESNLEALEKKIRLEESEAEALDIAKQSVEVKKQLAEAEDGLAKAKERHLELEKEWNAELEKDGVVSAETQNAYTNNQKAIECYNSAIETLTPEVDNLANKYDELAKSNLELADTTESATDSAEKYSETIINTANGSIVLKNATDEQVGAIQALADAYSSSQENARASLNTQIGLFEKLSNDSDLTSTQIKENLESQASVMKQMENDINELEKIFNEKDLSTDLLQQLASLGVDGAGYIHELATAAPEELQSVVAAFEEVNVAKDSLSAELATWSEEVKTAIANIGEDAEGKKVAEQIVGDIVTSFKDNSSKVTSEAKNIVDDSKKTMIDATKTFDEVGEAQDSKTADGIKANEGKVTKATEEVAKKTLETAKTEFGSDEFKKVGSNLVDKIAEGVKSNNAIAEAIKSAVKNAIKEAKNASSDDEKKKDSEGSEGGEQSGGESSGEQQASQSAFMMASLPVYSEYAQSINNASTSTNDSSLAKAIADSISDNVEIKATFEVSGDSASIFKVVRKEASTYAKATGRSAFND